MNHTAYERITERITALLEQGIVPWRKPWKTARAWPRNFVSHKPYRGINVFLLSALGYESPCWLTFRQASELGARVRKGEKSCPVVFWKRFEIEDQEQGAKKTIPLLRLYHVFNLAQCEGLKEAPEPALPGALRLPAEIVAGMPQAPTIRHGMAIACYSPFEDQVSMPDRARFASEEAYFSTLFHELVHSTGHESRLKRSTLAPQQGFGSDPYCREELVAEMGAAFLCGQTGIIEVTIQSTAAYIQGWLKRLQDDPTLIVQAAAQAQKAVDFILGKLQGEVTEVVL